ncbi:MAG: hypothetical protein KAQ96_02725, partial [Thermoplasmata archaeon]|nr:hypothetical protein [Thermoplasmata archaeon]
MARATIALAMLVSLLIVPTFIPVAGAEPIVIDRFSGGIEEATLDFVEGLTNSSLAIEIPAGAEVSSAEMKVEGIGGMGASNSTLDFANGVVGTNVWAYSNHGRGIYPPNVDPSNHRWTPAGNKDILLIANEDDERWDTITQDPQAGKPPGAYPIQLFRFHPPGGGVTSITVIWEGYGFSGGPQVQPCLAEMWLYNHTDSTWEQVTQYTARQKVDRWLNYTLTPPSPYVASNGSVDVAITGQRSIQAGPGIPAFSEGELHSDYIGIEVTGEGGIQYPPDMSLLIDGTELTNISGDLTGTLDIGDAQGFSTILQEVIDGYTVRPENLTLTFGFTVGRPTAGLLFVSSLSIEYEPVVNRGPHYNGPSDVEIPEDSRWTAVVDLDEAFEDDHNKGELVYELMEITHPPGSPPPAIFRQGTATNGNATLEVLPDQDFFGPFPVVYEIRATDLFGLDTVGYVNITVIQDPDEPKLDEPGMVEAHERTPFSYTMSITDPDIPDDEFTFSDDSEYFDIDPVTGKISWTPSSDQIGSHS